MALNISAWSIRNPLPSIVFSIILLVLGWVSFTKLAVTRLPSADIPYFIVDHRRPVGDHDPVRAGDQHRPRAQ
jgi:multidrug efflux pump subunit AcrB